MLEPTRATRTELAKTTTTKILQTMWRRPVYENRRLWEPVMLEDTRCLYEVACVWWLAFLWYHIWIQRHTAVFAASRLLAGTKARLLLVLVVMHNVILVYLTARCDHFSLFICRRFQPVPQTWSHCLLFTACCAVLSGCGKNYFVIVMGSVANRDIHSHVQ